MTRRWTEPQACPRSEEEELPSRKEAWHPSRKHSGAFGEPEIREELWPGRKVLCLTNGNGGLRWEPARENWARRCLQKLKRSQPQGPFLDNKPKIESVQKWGPLTHRQKGNETNAKLFGSNFQQKVSFFFPEGTNGYFRKRDLREKTRNLAWRFQGGDASRHPLLYSQ